MLFVESNLTGYNAWAVQIAAERGIPTQFIARDPDEYVGMTPDVLSIADTVARVDTYDVGKLIHHAAKSGARAMLAVDDYRLVPTAIAAQALGLPHADVLGLVNAHFKDRTRRLTDGIGPHVRHVVLDRSRTPDTSPLGYPCVLKPLDDSGSTGVTICHDDREFRAALVRVADVRRNHRDYVCSEGLLVEEYVEGEEFTAECMWDGLRDCWQLIGYTKKLLAPQPSTVETGAVFPYFFESALDRHIEGLVYRWLAAIGHRWGSAHVEFKVAADTATLIEVNPRLGGDQIRDLIRLTSGVDTIELYLDLAMGDPQPVGRVDVRNRAATSLFKLPERTGRILSVDPPERPPPGVVRHRLAKGPITIDGLRDNDDRLGYVITEGDSVTDSRRRADDFMAEVRVEYAR